MDILKDQLLLLCIFIICIGLITYCYVKSQSNERFENISINPFNNNEISNLTLKDELNTMLTPFITTLNKYSKIDPNITVNNNGVLCDISTTSVKNSCKVDTTNSNNYLCLVNNTPSSCNNLFSDGTINNNTNINLNTLTDNMRSTIIRNSSDLITDINNRSSYIDSFLDTMLDKLNLQAHQDFIILKNNNIINDKKIKVQQTTAEFEKNENDVFINKYNFQNFLIQNDNNNKKITLYRKILYGLVVAIIVVGIFLYMVSE